MLYPNYPKHEPSLLERDYHHYLFYYSNQFVDIYEKLFNLMFNTGIIPESWLLGTIKPLYKNKGNRNDPKNYRPITILRCQFFFIY